MHLDLTRQQQEMLPGGFTKAELITAIREGVETACLQGECLEYAGLPPPQFTVAISFILSLDSRGLSDMEYIPSCP